MSETIRPFECGRVGDGVDKRSEDAIVSHGGTDRATIARRDESGTDLLKANRLPVP